MAKEVILCVDDDSSVLNALRSLLSRTLVDGQMIELAQSGEEALEIIDELVQSGMTVALVIADYIMPGMRGDELLVRVHERLPEALTIMLTGQSDLSGVMRAINEAKLFRFLEKPWLNEDIKLTVQTAMLAFQLGADLRRNVLELSRVNAQLEQTVAERTAELVEKIQELEHLAVTDRLTGLYNRLFLDQVMEREFAAVARKGRGLAIILIDIDKFKRVNDGFGHHAGDAVLVAFAQILQERVRASDVVGRWGGEEFLLICSDTDLAGAARAAETLRQRVAASDFPSIGSCTASFGVAAYQAGDTVLTLAARADKALYAAKAGGRNRVCT